MFVKDIDFRIDLCHDIHQQRKFSIYSDDFYPNSNSSENPGFYRIENIFRNFAEVSEIQ